MPRILCLLLTLFIFSISSDSEAWHESISPTKWSEIRKRGEEKLMVFWEIEALLKFKYFKEIDADKCFSEIWANGLGSCLDKNSYHIPAEKVPLSQEDRMGNFSGIGIILDEKNGYLVITDIVPESPAVLGGIRAGDIMVAIDGKETREKEFYKVIEAIRGPEDTEVNITVSRGGRLLDFFLIRSKTKFLFSSLLYPDIGYLVLREFSGEDTLYDFIKGIEKIKKAGARRIIIDLRGNPGGLLYLAEAMLFLFVDHPEHVLVTKTSREGNETHRAEDVPEFFYGLFPSSRIKLEPVDLGRFSDLKVVVLVNENSASASEVFAGAMKELGHPIIGQSTYGKDTIQKEFNLSDGSAFRLTVGEYLVGSGQTKIRDTGVVPTHQVRNYGLSSTSEVLREDLQLQKATELLRK